MGPLEEEVRRIIGLAAQTSDQGLRLMFDPDADPEDVEMELRPLDRTLMRILSAQRDAIFRIAQVIDNLSSGGSPRLDE